MVTMLPRIGNHSAPFRFPLHFTLLSLFPDEIIILLHARKGEGIAKGSFFFGLVPENLRLPL